jgi:hypothetical protein
MREFHLNDNMTLLIDVLLDGRKDDFLTSIACGLLHLAVMKTKREGRRSWRRL